MAFLAKISSFLGAAEISRPTGVWEQIIMAFHNGIPNYAWAIIIFTLVLKIVLLPLDFFNRRMTVKNTKVQAVIQPEIEKIQKKYGNNKQMINQKTMEIYKKYNYNVTGSCVLMLVYMALTLFIFITLFSGLNSMAAYKVGYQYQEMEKVYDSVVVESGYNAYLEAYDAKEKEIYDAAYSLAYTEKQKQIISEKGYSSSEQLTAEDIEQAVQYAQQQATEAIGLEDNIQEMISSAMLASGGKSEAEFLTQINEAVLTKYHEVKDSWLWIDNVWKSDVPWTNSLASFDEFVSLARISYVSELGEGQEETFNRRLESNRAADEEKYANIMNAISGENRENGYLIIPILAVVINVLSILATQGRLKLPKKKDKTQVQNGEEKKKKAPGGIVMLILIPALMFYITLSYNAVFGLYILMSSLIGVLTTPLINFGIKKLDEFSEKKKSKNTEQPSYKR